MAYSVGDEVYVKQVNLLGTIVEQRLDEDIYLVSFKQYHRGSSLELADGNQQSGGLQFGSQEYVDEMTHLAKLVSQEMAEGHLSGLQQNVIVDDAAWAYKVRV